jgi:dienelactone hydrolase
VIRTCTFALFCLASCVATVAAKRTASAEHTNGTSQAVPSQAAIAIPTGTIIPKLPTLAATDQSYALYLPASYSPARRWPIIYVFAPDAHGEIPAALIKPAAEQFGYIIAASNNSKNGPWKPEAQAAQALFSDTHDRLAIDEQRIYFAGFSGGARVASQLAQSCECAQAVFLNGATFSTGTQPSVHDSFAIYLTVGLLDFNYPELTAFDARLETLGIPHFLRRFAGGHQWAPTEIWTEALAWAGLLAMKAGHKERDVNLVTTQLATFTATAQKIQQAGDDYFAWQFLRAMRSTFAGLTDTTAVEQQAAAMEKNASIRAGQKREKDEAMQQQAMEEAIYRVFSPINSDTADRNAVVQQTTQELIQLRDRAAHENNSDQHRVVERARRAVFAYFIANGESLINTADPSLARIYIALAAATRPETSWPQLALARCDAKMGRKKDAIRDLQKAVSLGLTTEDIAAIPTESPELSPLSGDPEFQKVAATAKPARPPSP